MIEKSNKKPVGSYQRRSYKYSESIDIMDVYKFHAKKQTAAEDPNIATWKGGDFEDRREYIAAKKRELGENLDRVLNLSSKRTIQGSKVKSDMGALEFDGVFRKQHINEGWIQPAQMQWSLETFNEKME